MATNRSVLTNALTQFFGKGITMITSLVIVKIITGFGADFYGDYVTAYEFLAFFGIIADAGLFAIAVKEISQSDSNNTPLVKGGLGGISQHHTPSFILGNILSMRLILIFIVSIIAVIAAQLVPQYSPQVKLGIYLTATSMALTIVAGTLSSVLQARMKIQYFTIGLVLGKIFLALSIYLLATTQSFPALEITNNHLLSTILQSPFYLFLIAGVASNLIFLIIVYHFARREIRIRPQFELDYWKQTLKVSLPYGLALILQTLYLRLDIILISILLGATATGVYGVAGRIMESFLVLGVFFGQSILPKISQEATQQLSNQTIDPSFNRSAESSQARNTLLWGIEKLLLIAIPITWSMWIFAPEIITILSSTDFISSPGFIGADTALKILLPTILFAYLNQLFTFTLVSKNRQNYLLIVNATALILNGGLNLYLLPSYGIIAAAATTVFCEVIVFSLLLREIQTQFSIFSRSKEDKKSTDRTQNLFIIIITNIVLFFFIYFTPLRNNLLYAGITAGAIYISLLYKFRKRLV